MLRNYLKISFRNLWKNKAYTLINVVGLAIGVSACLVIYLLVSFELSYDTFHSDEQRIFRVVSHIKIAGDDYKNAGVSAPIPLAAKHEFTGLDVVAAFHSLSVKKVIVPDGKGGEKKFTDLPDNRGTETIITDADYFKIFGYQWLIGNPEASLKEPFNVVLSESKARQYFGNAPLDKMIGRRLDYMDWSDTVTVSVSGIVKDWEQNTDFHFKDFISFATIEKTNWNENIGLTNGWDNTNSSSQMFVKLAKNSSIAQIERQFPSLLKKNIKKKEDREGRSFELQPLRDIHFNSKWGGDYVRLAHLPTLYVLMGVAAFLLLIAAINFINLATAQSVERAKEIGIRKVLGSSRASLIGQFLSETFVITTVAVLLSLVIANPALYAFKNLIPKGVKLDLFQPTILLFLGGITILTSLLSGIYPSLVLSSYQPASSLKNKSAGRNAGQLFLRKGLIVFQFVVSIVFIIGTMVVLSQIHFMLNKDMGFKKEAIINFRTPWQDHSNRTQVLLEKIKQLSEIEMVCLSQSTPARRGYSTSTYEYNNGKQKIELNVHRKAGDANFIPLYSIQLLAGRNVINSDTAREYVINETYMKALGFQKPQQVLNKYLKGNGRNLPIVGVVKDFHVQSLHTAIQPMIIASENSESHTLSLKINTKGKELSDFKAIMLKVEKLWRGLYPEQDKFEYEFFDETIAQFYQEEQKIAQIVNTATAIAILISCLGLFGLVSFTTSQRTKEIGIRKVLGAGVLSIVSLLSKDFLKLVVIAIVIASPIAWFAMHKWLQDFAYRIDIAWWIFVVSGVLAMLIALLTVSYQSIRAAIANPIESLRTE